MQLKDREPVIGTMPTIYIGHRFNKDRKTGNIRISAKWHADYNYLGKKFHESLKTTNKSKAISAAHVIAQRIERGEQRHIQRRVEWDEFRDGYLEYIRMKGRAAKTVEKYHYVTSCFVSFVKDQRNRSRPELTSPTDFWAFNEHMANNELHEKTIEDRLVIVKQMYKWAVNTEKPPMFTINPLAGEEVEEAESSPQPCFNPSQVAQLLAKADKNHEGPVYAVLAYLGLRFGEAKDLRWSDFDFSRGNGWVKIQRGGTARNNKTKNRTSRAIPIKKELRDILNHLPRHDDGLLFHQRPSKKYPNGGRPLSGDRLLKSLKRLCRRCGFENPNQYKLHTFRHAFASMLARNNVSYKQALAWMGHSNSKILDRYITFFDPDAEAAMSEVVYAAEMSNH